MTAPATRTAAHGLARTSTLDRPTLMRLAASEYNHFSAALGGLSPADWAKATDCPEWDLRALASHVLGMAEFAASVRTGARQQRAARKRGGVFIDALTAVQVDERRHLSGPDIVERLATMGPKAAKARRRTPGFIRRRTMPVPQNINGTPEMWSLGYLIDTVLTRDVWMHRIDAARATGSALALTPGHDGVIVADVVAEWVTRHGQPCEVRLSGPAGGSWSFGAGGEVVTGDAVEFARALAGRAPAAGLLATQVPF